MTEARNPAGAGRRFDLIVFDWDGTLMDSTDAIVTAIRRACRDLELPVPTVEKSRYIIGLGLQDALSHLLPGVPVDHYPRVAERYRDHFLELDSGTGLYPGAAGMVSGLHAEGYRLAVATGKSRRGFARALAATGLARYFHASRCGDEGHVKPHPGMLQALLEELRVPSARALMVGDTTHDLLMARSAGVAGLGVSYGAHPREALLACSPIACVQCVDELREWFASHA